MVERRERSREVALARDQALEKLRGAMDVDAESKSDYYRKRFASFVAGEPIWIARSTDPVDAAAYNYYVGQRLGYLEVEVVEGVESYTGYRITSDGTGELVDHFESLGEAVASLEQCLSPNHF